MTKTELIARIAEAEETSKKAAGEQLDTMVDVIVDALADGEEVSLSGLGKFSVVDVAERTGIIQMGDRKGETYVTPAHKAPKFKAAKALKDAVM